MTRTSTNSPMSAIRSSAIRTARWNSRSPSGRSGRESRGYRHSRPSEAERTSSCPAEARSDTSRRCSVAARIGTENTNPGRISDHGDELVPRSSSFGQYTRSLMKGLEVPVLNQFGLRHAVIQGTDQIAPLTVNKDLDKLGLLNGVSTFNFHLHLPHYALTTKDTTSVHVLARQPIDLSRPHPFTAAGNREFNSFIWMPPTDTRGGDILLADSTIFTTLFGGTESLEHFWWNVAKLR